MVLLFLAWIDVLLVLATLELLELLLWLLLSGVVCKIVFQGD